MDTPTCKTCTHFRQHFVLTDDYAAAVYCGHCVHPRLKHTRPDKKACPHYKEQAKENPLPCRRETVHFLTTRVLESILTLELPPEIRKE